VHHMVVESSMVKSGKREGGANLRTNRRQDCRGTIWLNEYTVKVGQKGGQDCAPYGGRE
jgi:hypothetical protein